MSDKTYLIMLTLLALGLWLALIEYEWTSSVVERSVFTVAVTEPSQPPVLSRVEERFVNSALFHSVNGLNVEQPEQRLRYDWTKRQCVLHGVGIDLDGTIVYYADPTEDRSDGFFDTVGRFAVKYRIQESPIPTEPIMDNGTYVFVSNDCPISTGPGHDYDFCFTTFNLMVNTGMLALSNTIVHATCETRTKTWDMMSKDVITMNQFKERVMGRIVHQVILGPLPAWSVNLPNLRFGYLGKMMRDRGLELLHVRSQRNDNPIIGVRKKTSRHRILNHDALLVHLRQRFPNYTVIEFEPEKLSFKDEITLVHSMDVYITPIGGGSFSQMFMKDGSTAIHPEICYPKTFNQPLEGNTLECAKLEYYIWGRFPWYFKRYFRATELNQLVYEGSVPSPYRREPPSWMDYSYNADFTVIDHLVQSALLRRR
jgi:hypothetical protein